MKLEVVVVPVSDVDKAKDFYQGLGWRMDGDFTAGEDFRRVQLTRPGSACSIVIGTGLTSAAPGSTQGLQLVVPDIGTARAELVNRGAGVSGVFHHAGAKGRVPGPAPDRKSYGSFVAFSDPDGNQWFVQEVTTRLPGRVTTAPAAYETAHDLVQALRRAAAAHSKQMGWTGHADPHWPDWYAEYMVREQAGQELPT